MPGKMDFFISYNSADREWAEWVAWHLENAGFKTMIQAWDFRPGSNFVLDMQTAASKCERTIAVLSPNYLNASYTQPEWAAAFGEDPTGTKGTLLPIRIQECELKGLLRNIVYIDLVGLAENDAIDRLIAGIGRGRTKPAKAPKFPGQKQPKFPAADALPKPKAKIDLEVLISYSSKDAERAGEVRAELETHGVSVWRDLERIRAGAEFDIAIEQAIRRADAIVVLITHDTGNSKWVRNEIEYAKYAKKRIIPLLLDKDAPPIINIMSLQHIPFHESWQTGMQKLMFNLEEIETEKNASSGSTNQSQIASVFQPSLEKASSDKNPFLYGGAIPVDFFEGRESALTAIKNRVGNYYSLQSLSVVSNRRMGKTSLLNYVWKQGQALFPSGFQYVTVFIDAMDARAHTIEGVMRMLRRGISRQLQRELWPESDDGKLPVLSEAFEELCDDKVRLVLLLDEWESVMAYRGLDPFLYTLRSSGSLGWIGMITATAHLLSELQEKGGLVSNFYNIFGNTVYLGNMPRTEWEVIIRKGFERSGGNVTDQDYDLVDDLAGGHPYLTQLAGSLLWQSKRENQGEDHIRTRFSQEAQMIFTDLWQRLSAEHVLAIKYALSLKETRPANENTVTDLKMRGTLTQDGELFCSPFADFVYHEVRNG